MFRSHCVTLLRVALEYFGTAETELLEVEISTIVAILDELVRNEVRASVGLKIDVFSLPLQGRAPQRSSLSLCTFLPGTEAAAEAAFCSQRGGGVGG